jgi:hypothetical protein
MYIYHGYVIYEVYIPPPHTHAHAHTVSFVINTLFPPLRATLYADRVKPLLRCRVLQALRVSARCHPQNGVLGVHPSRGQNDGSRRMLNRDCKEYKGKQILRIVMVIVLWDSEGMLSVEFLTTGAAFNSDRYVQILTKLKVTNQKCSAKQKNESSPKPPYRPPEGRTPRTPLCGRRPAETWRVRGAPTLQQGVLRDRHTQSQAEVLIRKETLR